jgi:vacuolar protein sorting-associated protein 13A/C
MAKQLLVGILVDHLGQFIEGLSESNVKLGVWSGKVELKNLKLKSGVLDDLNLPIVITHGSLKNLKLKIPWTSLDSKPVKVVLDGLYIVISPIDISSMSSEQIKKNAAADKRKKLLDAENKILNSTKIAGQPESGKKKTSYMQHFAAKIIDNLEITITNIHIRYEDKVTIRGVTFSGGLTLDTISLNTTDENWTEKFMSRDDKLTTNIIHKLGRICNLGLYCKLIKLKYSRMCLFYSILFYREY